MDLTELKTRLDEDEAAARALCDGDWGDRPWAVEACSDKASGECPCIVYQGEYKPFDEAQVPLIRYIADAETPLIAAHIARHDPARVLREVAVKRAIIAVHGPLLSTYGEPPTCSACWPYPKIGTHPLWPCSTMRALAAVYSDHPGYRDEWKP